MYAHNADAEYMEEIPTLHQTDSHDSGLVKKLPNRCSKGRKNLGKCWDTCAGTRKIMYAHNAHAEYMEEIPTLYRTDSHDSGLVKRLPDRYFECPNNLGNCQDSCAGRSQMVYECAE